MRGAPRPPDPLTSPASHAGTRARTARQSARAVGVRGVGPGGHEPRWGRHFAGRIAAAMRRSDVAGVDPVAPGSGGSARPEPPLGQEKVPGRGIGPPGSGPEPWGGGRIRPRAEEA